MMADKSALLLIPILTIAIVLSLSISNVNAVIVNNTDFSIDIPDNWSYRDRDTLDSLYLTPNKFGALLIDPSKLFDEDEHVISRFAQDLHYIIENSILDVYVKYRLDTETGMKVTSKQNITIDGEPAVKVYGDGIDTYNGTKFVEYLVMHNKEPYRIVYMANVKNFEKYLPEFEQIVKTFKFTK